MLDKKDTQKWTIPDDAESLEFTNEWRLLADDQKAKNRIREWAKADDDDPRFSWPDTPEMKEIRANWKAMTESELEKRLEEMYDLTPMIFEGAQFKALLKKTRETPRRGPRAEPSSLKPEDCIRNIISFIHDAGPNGICARFIERKFYPDYVQTRSKLHRWLADLVTIGLLDKKEVVIPSIRNPSKRKKSVYYRTTEHVMFPREEGIRWSISGQRLEDQIAHMPFYVTDSKIAERYGINVPEITVMACRRLRIAKAILIWNAGILEPNEAIDEEFKKYYGEESPNPPSVM